MNKRIILCSGGTGGHVIPSVIFGNYLIKKGYTCILILDRRGEKYSASFKGKIYIINSAHLSGNLFYKIRSLISLTIGFIQSIFIILKFNSRNFISFGSYATAMPLAIIVFLKIFIKVNIFIHEQNSVIGKVNSFFLPYAKNLFTNFDLTKNINNKYKAKQIYTGLPIYEKNFIQNIKDEIKSEKKILFIFGGSQGSVSLVNNFLLMLNNLDIKTLNNTKIFIQAKKDIHSKIAKILKNFDLEFEIREFYLNIQEILSITDLAITRAGAGTINDLINYNIPSIIFPLPSSINNHQYYNAKFLKQKKAAILLDEKNFDVIINSNILNELIKNENKRNLMINELKKINIPNANKIILSNIKK